MHTSKIKKEQGCWWNKSKHQVNLACGLETFLETLMSVVLAHELREKICCWSWNIIWNVFPQPKSEKKFEFITQRQWTWKDMNSKRRGKNLCKLAQLKAHMMRQPAIIKRKENTSWQPFFVTALGRYQCFWLDKMASKTKYLWKDFFPKGKRQLMPLWL